MKHFKHTTDMTKTSAATEITQFAKASFVKQNNYNLGSKLEKKMRINTGSDIAELKFFKYWANISDLKMLIQRVLAIC